MPLLMTAFGALIPTLQYIELPDDESDEEEAGVVCFSVSGCSFHEEGLIQLCYGSTEVVALGCCDVEPPGEGGRGFHTVGVRPLTARPRGYRALFRQE